MPSVGFVRKRENFYQQFGWLTDYPLSTKPTTTRIMKRISSVSAVILILIGGYLAYAGWFFYGEHKRSAKVHADNIEMSQRLDAIIASIADRKGITPKEVLSEYSPAAAQAYYSDLAPFGSYQGPPPVLLLSLVAPFGYFCYRFGCWRTQRLYSQKSPAEDNEGDQKP